MNFLNRFQYAKTTYLASALVVLILVAVNVISLRHFVRVDLTKNQFFALSPAAQTIVRELDDIVNVDVYFSDTLPSDLFTVRQYLEDILSELNSYSKGNLRIKFRHPDQPDIAEEAISLGIPQVQMNIVEKDKFEVKNGFLGVAVSYGDQTEVLPVVQNILNIEYDLVSAIKKVTATSPKVVGFVIGHDEPAFESNVSLSERSEETMTTFRQALDRNYVVRQIDLASSASLQDVDTLMIVGSKTVFSTTEQYHLDQFLLNGGNVIVFLDGLGVSPELVATAQAVNLYDQIAHYGVDFESTQLVLDTSSERVSFNNGYLNFLVAYPYWVKAVNDFFDQEHPVVSKLTSVVFPWVSPLRITDQEGAESTVLIRSTDQAWVTQASDGMSLSPNAVQPASQNSQFDLAVLLDGSFTSFFDDAPVGISNRALHLDDSSAVARLMVVGNARFITDAVLEQFGNNLSFAMNAVDSLTLDDSLIDIRSKRSFEAPLKELTLNQRQLVKWVGTLLMPLLTILYGVFRFIKRRQLTRNR